MPTSIFPLLIAQFISAFADNAILFAVIAIVLKSGDIGGWYVPALQSAFIVAYVILAPWAGQLADRYPKALVMIAANAVKAFGTGMILLGLEPMLGYAVVGVGAAAYSPAKYGILPELMGGDRLVRANSWIEGATIAAVLLGMLAGGKVADISIAWALGGILALYGLSALIGVWIPRIQPREAHAYNPLLRLWTLGRELLSDPIVRLVLLALSLFWSMAAALRLLLVAWAPLVLGLRSAGDIAELTLFLAIGIVVGATLAPWLVRLSDVRRVRFAAYAMACGVAALAVTDDLQHARLLLLAVGATGGILIVPLNANLQHAGHHSIGSGNAVAIQNFFQSVAMLVAVGVYTVVAGSAIHPATTFGAMGVAIFGSALWVSLRLPPRVSGQ